MISARTLAWIVCGLFVALIVYEILRPIARPKNPEPLTAAPISHLPPPAPPGSLGGAAIGEPAAMPAGYTNEMLHKDFEAQKARMGIKAIIIPSPARRAITETLRRLRAVSSDVERLKASPSPTPISGTTPALLAQPPRPKTNALIRQKT